MLKLELTPQVISKSTHAHTTLFRPARMLAFFYL